jgi:predicted metal-dependent peptidase
MSMATTKEFDPLIKAKKSGFKACPITPQQREAWMIVKTKFMWDAPYFSDVFYRLMNPKGTEQVAAWTEEVPIAATDGVNLLLNPKEFFSNKYTLGNRVFVVGHEVLHAVFNHPGMMHMWSKRKYVTYPSGKKIPFNGDLMNIAMDHVINAILIESKLGEFKKGEWIHDPQIATAKDSVIDTYAKLYKMGKGGGRGSGGSAGQGAGNGRGFDIILKPGEGDGKDADQADQDRSEHEWQTAIAAGIAAAKVQGKLPAGMALVFGEVLEPVVDWTDKIQSFFARKVGCDSYDWRKPDRRLILRDLFAPAMSGHGCGTVVVGVDSSGSITGEPKTLDRFMAEVSGILEEVKPRQLFLLWCDAAVHRADELEDAGDLNVVRAKGPLGGGGTSFVPVFDWIEKNQIEPDALVYLTDMYGTFPSVAPSYPVLWGSISKDIPAPFGEVVEVPIQE